MPQLFIVYRQADSGFITRQIADRLAVTFGASNLMTIAQEAPPNVDLRDDVFRLASESRVVMVIIGQQWAQDPRLQNRNDLVRIAIEVALQNPLVRVLPVVVNNAMMPSVQALPPSIQQLCYRGATSVRDLPYFDQDTAGLVRSVQHLLQATPPPISQSSIPYHTPNNLPSRSIPRQNDAPSPRPIIIRENNNGCWGIPLLIFGSVIGAITSLIGTIVHAMVASVVSFIMGIVIMIVVGGLVLAFGSSLLQNNMDIGLALNAIVQSISQLLGNR
jgi:hypothetical protein